MTHYTILPMEVVMSGWEQMEAQSFEINLHGITMDVQPLSATQATIIRIRSGNAQDYLNPNYNPGQIVEFRPVG